MELYNDLLPDPLPTEPMALADRLARHGTSSPPAAQSRRHGAGDRDLATASRRRAWCCARSSTSSWAACRSSRTTTRARAASSRKTRAPRWFSTGITRIARSASKASWSRRRPPKATRISSRATGNAASAPGPARRASRCARASSSTPPCAPPPSASARPHPTPDNINEPHGRRHSAAALLGRVLRLGRCRRAVDRRRRAHPRARALDPLANYRRRGLPGRALDGDAPAALTRPRVAQAAHRDPAADPRHRGLFELVRPAQHHRLGRNAVDRRVSDQCRGQRSHARTTSTR